MEIEPNRAVMPSGKYFVRWGLHGGALAALAPLIYFLVPVGNSISFALLVLGSGAAIGGSALAVIGLLLRRRKNTLGAVEGDLKRARGMMERRLIDEDDYRRLKSHLLEKYQSGSVSPRPIRPIAFWGAVLGAAIIGFSFLGPAGSFTFDTVLLAMTAAGLIGGCVSGGTAEAYMALVGPGSRFRLPAPTNRRLLDE